MLFFLLIHESAMQIKDLFSAIRELAKKWAKKLRWVLYFTNQMHIHYFPILFTALQIYLLFFHLFTQLIINCTFSHSLESAICDVKSGYKDSQSVSTRDFHVVIIIAYDLDSEISIWICDFRELYSSETESFSVFNHCYTSYWQFLSSGSKI